ncbi:hypothetical protein JKP88DRAFT_250521 [Tribonema minus]|uniref:Uncharacterized protein n=1 Tax=Tribonema minus TaxID=303371 RepID=A0A835YID0_9STRA|nr:hypothetical protein JKP88DRAFT_250521 [Tribonema minus]
MNPCARKHFICEVSISCGVGGSTAAAAPVAARSRRDAAEARALHEECCCTSARRRLHPKSLHGCHLLRNAQDGLAADRTPRRRRRRRRCRCGCGHAVGRRRWWRRAPRGSSSGGGAGGGGAVGGGRAAGEAPPQRHYLEIPYRAWQHNVSVHAPTYSTVQNTCTLHNDHPQLRALRISPLLHALLVCSDAFATAAQNTKHTPHENRVGHTAALGTSRALRSSPLLHALLVCSGAFATAAQNVMTAVEERPHPTAPHDDSNLLSDNSVLRAWQQASPHTQMCRTQLKNCTRFASHRSFMPSSRSCSERASAASQERFPRARRRVTAAAAASAAVIATPVAMLRQLLPLPSQRHSSAEKHTVAALQYLPSEGGGGGGGWGR